MHLACLDGMASNGTKKSSVPAGKKAAGKAGKQPQPVKKRKRQTRKPDRKDFASDEDYEEAFSDWTRFREAQRQSVNKSRAKAKREALEQELETRFIEHDNQMLELKVADLQAKIAKLKDELGADSGSNSLDTNQDIDFIT